MNTANEPNVIKHEGVTLFRNSVVGIVDETQALITVGTLSQQWKEARDTDMSRMAEVCDALRVLVDECIQERKHSKEEPIDLAIQQALTVLSGDEPSKQVEPSADTAAFGPIAASVKNDSRAFWEGYAARLDDERRKDGARAGNPYSWEVPENADWAHGYTGRHPHHHEITIDKGAPRRYVYGFAYNEGRHAAKSHVHLKNPYRSELAAGAWYAGQQGKPYPYAS